MEVRPATVADLPGIYAVCAENSSGAQNPDLVGHVYAGSYVAAPTAHAQVIVDELGVAGYFLFTLDTSAHAAWCETDWWPVLRAQYPRGSGAGSDARLVDAIHDPPWAPSAIAAAYPAHFHIDFRPRARGLGYARRFLDALVEQVRADGLGGIHLDVGLSNTNAIALYQHFGFEILERRTGAAWMGLVL